MKIPPQLKIGPHLFTVVFADLDGKCGTTDWDGQTITIDAKLQPSMAAETMWHEVKHVLCNEMEHCLLSSLAQQEIAVLIENKLCFDPTHAHELPATSSV